MGFFSSVANKLKRVVSLNNLTRLVTGNFTDVGKDLLRVATTPDPNAKNGSVPVPAMLPVNTQIPQPIADVLAVQGAKFQQQVVNKIASDTNFQNVTDLFTKAGIQAFWLKNKMWFIGAGVAIVAIFTIHHFTKTSHTRGNVRKR